VDAVTEPPPEAGDVTRLAALDAFGRRMLGVRRACVYAALSIVMFAGVFAVGLAHRRGLVDGFGHVIACDLFTLREAGRIVRDGNGHRLYDFALQHEYQAAALLPEHVPGIVPFISPPFLALAYVPWTGLAHGPAFALWSALVVAGLGGALLVLRPWTPRAGAHWPVAMLLALSFVPVLEGLTAGSNSLVAVPVFAAVFAALKSGRDGAAGAILALVLCRPQLALAPVVVLLWKRRMRALLGFGAVAAGLFALSMALVDRDAPFAWLRLSPLMVRMIVEPGLPQPLFSSLYALFILPLGPERFALGMAAGTVASAVLLGVLLHVWRGPWRPESDDFDLRFAALVVATPLVSQYLQLHDLGLLVIPAVLVTERWVRQPEAPGWGIVRMAFAVLWLTCMVGPALAATVLPVPLTPLAVLLLGWAVLFTGRRVPSPPAA
jgi:hypothetical protein